jgi:hypothetical protein
VIYGREGGHLTDALRISFMDGALRPLARRRVTRHLSGCVACAQRLQVLRNADASVQTLLRSAPVELPLQWLERARQAERPSRVRGRARGWVRHHGQAIAAALLAAAVVALLAPPAIGMASEWLHDLRARLKADSPPAQRQAAPARGSPGSATASPPNVIRFVPATGVLHVSFESAAGVTLTVGRTSSQAVMFAADATTSAGSPSSVPMAPVVVEPSGLAVRNAGGAGGNYDLSIPPSVTRLELSVAGRLVRIISPADIEKGVRLRLGSDE